MTDSFSVVERLRSAINGEVIDSLDPAYDDARAVTYGGFDRRRPLAIVRPRTAAEVAEVVNVAVEGGIELAVRGGGHSVAGHSTTEGGIVLDLLAMKNIEIDSEARTAWAATGLTAGEYTNAVAEHGLATGFGDTATVGIGGLTLGGGIGLLSRKYGLTIDNVLAAEIVTASGEVLEIGADAHPDLFWAIRGGGGNFGVVTKFKYRLHPVSEVVGGMLMLPATADVVHGLIEAADAAPEELTTIINVLSALPMPLPEPVEGPVAMVVMAYTGDIAEGERVVAPFRELAEPIMDMVGPTQYPKIFEGPPEADFSPVVEIRTNFADKIDRATVGYALDEMAKSTALFSVVQVRALGGAIARVPADDTAYAHRDRPFMTAVTSIFEDENEREEHARWVEPVAERLSNGPSGVYVGFMGDGSEGRIRAAYPGATYERLAQVKSKYDPDNVFRINQNVKPG